MATMYCALCQRHVEARRHVGIGTAVAALLTAGLALLAIPVYPKRCSICHSTAVTDDPRAFLRPAPATAPPDRVQQQLEAMQDDLDAAAAEVDRLTTERDFYRQLLGDRAPPRPAP